jgi:demethylmenaquinone methyltransferase/2-methoxy-6-polyprenyl-1,4-benzoquinol methylase
MQSYRRRAVELLQLRRGDRVVELGCGTGLNFPLIIEQIGSEGRLVGADISPKMLACARQRVDRAGWKNVELVESDIARYVLPHGINGVLSVGVFGYLEEYDRVIEAASHALVHNGHLVILDGRQPESLPSWVFKIILWLARPFGVSREYFENPTWESVDRYFENMTLEKMYGGMIYVSSGSTPADSMEVRPTLPSDVGSDCCANSGRDITD